MFRRLLLPPFLAIPAISFGLFIFGRQDVGWWVQIKEATPMLGHR